MWSRLESVIMVVPVALQSTTFGVVVSLVTEVMPTTWFWLVESTVGRKVSAFWIMFSMPRLST